VGAGRHRARTLPDRHLADNAAGGRPVMGPGPSAVIDLRDAQTGDARATRVRQLATPSWLSTRPKPTVQRHAALARETVARTASSTWSSPPRPEDSRFFSLALRVGAAMTRDDLAARHRAIVRLHRAGGRGQSLRGLDRRGYVA
jgi:hypothetical protein